MTTTVQATIAGPVRDAVAAFAAGELELDDLKEALFSDNGDVEAELVAEAENLVSQFDLALGMTLETLREELGALVVEAAPAPTSAPAARILWVGTAATTRHERTYAGVK